MNNILKNLQTLWKGNNLLTQTCQIVGATVLSYYGLSILLNTVKTLRKLIPKDLAARYGKNSWVVVTGASDGIGKGFCEEFAKEGFNIVLIARNQEKLQRVAQELTLINPQVQTRIIVADFTKASEEDFFENITKQLEGLDISVLVNNVGLGKPSAFADLDEAKLREILLVNTVPQVMMSRILVKQLQARPNRSAIISLSSGMGVRPLPYNTIYSSTKAFNDYFSRALAGECSNIDVISLRPSYVATPMIAAWKKKDFFQINPNECARGLMNRLGYENYTFGHWKHRVFLARLTLTPDWIFERQASKIGYKLLQMRLAGSAPGVSNSA